MEAFVPCIVTPRYPGVLVILIMTEPRIKEVGGRCNRVTLRVGEERHDVSADWDKFIGLN